MDPKTPQFPGPDNYSLGVDKLNDHRYAGHECDIPDCCPYTSPDPMQPELEKARAAAHVAIFGKPVPGHNLPKAAKTYWSGQPCMARRCRIVVGKDPVQHQRYWARDFIGYEREAVEITVFGEHPSEHCSVEQTFFIDNEGGHGWDKVTFGKGDPKFGHASLYPDTVLEYLPEPSATLPKGSAYLTHLKEKLSKLSGQELKRMQKVVGGRTKPKKWKVK